MIPVPSSSNGLCRPHEGHPGILKACLTQGATYWCCYPRLTWLQFLIMWYAILEPLEDKCNLGLLPVASCSLHNWLAHLERWEIMEEVILWTIAHTGPIVNTEKALDVMHNGISPLQGFVLNYSAVFLPHVKKSTGEFLAIQKVSLIEY